MLSEVLILFTHINSQGKKKKRLFWLPAIAPLLSVILSTLIVFLTKGDKHGIKIVKHIKGGFNPSSVHQLQLTGPFVGEVAKVGLIVAVVALTVGDHLFISTFNKNIS
jgi:low affinity sulfate transporter 2